MSEEAPKPVVSQLRLASEVIAHIPARWRGAEIFVAGTLDRIHSIKRVSLQKNALGRLVVILHEEDYQ